MHLPQVCALPDAAVPLMVKPASQALQSTAPLVSQSVSPVPVASVAVPFGHVHSFAVEIASNRTTI